MTSATRSPAARSRWIRWVAEASATDMPMPWTHVRPPRGSGVRLLQV